MGINSGFKGLITVLIRRHRQRTSECNLLSETCYGIQNYLPGSLVSTFDGTKEYEVLTLVALHFREFSL